MKAARAGIALGSNLGNREKNLTEAVEALRAISEPGECFLEASFHETEPWNCPPDSPPFLNSVVELGYLGDAPQLLQTLLDIETAMGRVRGTERNSPRVIDLDLLYMDDLRYAIPELILPHPRISERRFVLEPLAEIRPDFILPGQSLPVRGLLEILVDSNNQSR